MEPNESHHQQQQQQRLSSPYFHHHLQQHHHPSPVVTGNAVPSSNNGLFPPQQQQQHQPNDGSSSHAVYNPHSVPSSAVTEPLKRKRGRPRKYVTPEQALEAKKMASAASSSSAKERREQAAAAGGGTTTTTSSNPGSSKKSQLGSVGKTGQSFTPHIVNIAPGEDVAQKIMMFAQQSKHELCVLSASGTISTASLRQSGGNISYEGQYEIISLSGSFIRAEQGGKTGGLSVSLSRSDGQIIGGAVGTHLTAAGPVQVILGTFQLDRKKDGVKGEASNSGSRLTSPSSTGPGPGPGPLLGMGFRSVMESPGRNPMRGNDEHHHHHQQTGMGGSHHFMMQAPQGMHMTHPRPSEWGGGGNSGHDGRGGGGWEAGKAARESLKKKIETYKQGLVVRRKEIEQATVGLEKDGAELKKLRSEEKILKGLVQQLKERKEEIEKVEEKERLQKEKEEKERKEAELAAQPGKGDSEEVKADDNEKVEGSTDGEEEMPGAYQDSEDLDENEHHDEIGNYKDFPTDEEPAADTEPTSILEEATHTNPADEHVVETKKESPSSEDSISDGSENDGSTKKDDSVSEKKEELSKEELGRLVASRWTGEKSDKPTEADDIPKADDQGNHEHTPTTPHEVDEDDGFVSDGDEDTADEGKYSDHEPEDDTYEEESRHDSTSSYKSDAEDDLDLSEMRTSNPTWLEKIQKTVKNILQAVNLIQTTPVDKSEADRVRKEYDESSSKLNKIQSRVSSLEKKLKQDFGPEKEFYSFHGRCFESKQGKYTYKVCGYKEATQEEGYSKTRLGEWEKFENSYQFMTYTNGDKCWNGPDRSLKIKLRCGLKNELMDVDEPSRCEYAAVLSTPARCLEDKLKELEQKLEKMMSQDQPPHSHDEL